MKKIILTILLLFSLIILVNAQTDIEYGIWAHKINIDVDIDGQAAVTERFHIFFINDSDQRKFRELSSKFGTNLDNWEEFNSIFKNNIGGDRALNKRVNFSDSEDTFLEISYILAESLMAKGKETSLIIEYSIKANYLNSLYESGMWIIPENTSVSIILPAGAEVRQTVRPQATITNYGSNRKMITWEGYISSNELIFQYYIWKKIEPIIDLNKLNEFLFRTPQGLTIIGVIIAIILIIIWKRKIISEKIENFVEANTIIKED